MPRPGSSVVSPKLYDDIADYFPHLVTIKRPQTTRAPSGAVVNGDPVLFLNAVPARVLPLGSVGMRKPTTGEIRRADGTIVTNPVDVELNGAYEGIEVTDVAEFDGKTWNILNVFAAPADGRTVLQMEFVE